MASPNKKVSEIGILTRFGVLAFQWCRSPAMAVILSYLIMWVALEGLSRALVRELISLQSLVYWVGIVLYFGLLPAVLVLWAIPNWRSKKPFSNVVPFFLATGILVFLHPGMPLMVDVQGVLNDGRLGPLPVTATDVRTGHWRSLFSGERFLSFRASAGEIDRFIQQSFEIASQEPERFTPKHRYLEMVPGWEKHREHSYFSRHGLMPFWFIPQVNERGRIYSIPQAANGHDWGEVVIDDEKQVVYIRVIRS